MLKVEVDKKNNLLKFTIASVLTVKEAALGLKETEKALLQLKPNLFILTDISNVEDFDNLTKNYIDQIMDICNEKGVVKIARVIPNLGKDIGLNIMSLFHYHKDVKTITCNNSEEALKRLFL